MRNRRATAVRGVPIRGYGNDNIGADAERIIEVKVASRCVLRGDIAVGCAHAHALHVRRRAGRDCFLQGTRVEAFNGHGRACVQVSVVHGIFGYHRRDYEELARSRDFLFWQCMSVSQTWYSKGLVSCEPSWNIALDGRAERTWVEAEKVPNEPCGHRCLVVVPG